MKKNLLIIIFMFTLFFLTCKNVFAECTYDTRKQLLEEAKKVTTTLDVDYDKKLFILKIYNITENIYIIISNNYDTSIIDIHNYDLTDGVYTFNIDNTNDIIKYRINIYSNNSDCYSKNLTNKIITKGLINKYADEDICDDIKDYYYCNEILNSKINLTEEEVIKKIKSYKNSILTTTISSEKSNNKYFEFIKKYWLYEIIGLFCISLIIYVLVMTNKKRSEL